MFDIFSGLFYGLSLYDFALIFGVLLWSPLLLFSLKGVDLDNRLIAAMYMAFSVFSGFTLSFVFLGVESDLRTEFFAFLFFSGAAALFWLQQRRRGRSDGSTK